LNVQADLAEVMFAFCLSGYERKNMGRFLLDLKSYCFTTRDKGKLI
jgi:hypothetical protein